MTNNDEPNESRDEQRRRELAEKSKTAREAMERFAVEVFAVFLGVDLRSTPRSVDLSPRRHQEKTDHARSDQERPRS